MKLFKSLKKKFKTHIILPILESHSPIPQAALGSAIGMFWGLTPTVGIQMWLVWLTWILLKLSMNLRFDLIIGTAMVWISNPLTMFFMYYGFLLTGYFFFESLGIEVNRITYDTFTAQLSAITNNADSSAVDVMINGAEFLLLDLGYPMVIGSLFYAIPLAFLSYFVTSYSLKINRMLKAEKMGIPYEQWRKRFERATGSADLMLNKKHHKKHHLPHRHHKNHED